MAGNFGSSPTTRGAQAFYIDMVKAGRLIPDYAGSTCWGVGVPPCVGLIPDYAGSTGICGLCRLVVWAHPRLRGEHFSGGN